MKLSRIEKKAKKALRPKYLRMLWKEIGKGMNRALSDPETQSITWSLLCIALCAGVGSCFLYSTGYWIWGSVLAPWLPMLLSIFVLDARDKLVKVKKQVDDPMQLIPLYIAKMIEQTRDKLLEDQSTYQKTLQQLTTLQQRADVAVERLKVKCQSCHSDYLEQGLAIAVRSQKEIEHALTELRLFRARLEAALEEKISASVVIAEQYENLALMKEVHEISAQAAALTQQASEVIVQTVLEFERRMSQIRRNAESCLSTPVRISARHPTSASLESIDRLVESIQRFEPDQIKLLTE